MTQELTILTYAALLLIIQIGLSAVGGIIQNGLSYSISSRDSAKPLAGIFGRTDRALNNYYSALVLFTIAVVVLTLAGKSNDLTVNCAWVFLAARIAYIPAYIFGIIFVRSLIWGIGLTATIVMLVVALQ